MFRLPNPGPIAAKEKSFHMTCVSSLLHTGCLFSYLLLTKQGARARDFRGGGESASGERMTTYTVTQLLDSSHRNNWKEIRTWTTFNQ